MPSILIRSPGFAIALAVSHAALGAEWPVAEDAWMEAPDGYAWPGSLAEISLEDMPVQVLDVALDGTLVPSLESITTPEQVRAAWVELDGGGAMELLYVDKALSGTGGLYIHAVTRSKDGWKWMGDMLCERITVSRYRQEGWSSLTCEGQRGLRFQRSLYAVCGGKYTSVRHELHDPGRGVVEVSHEECTP